MDINGNTFLITGGSSGLGWATANHFARAGARVVIADVNRPKAELAGGVEFVKADVTSETDVASAVAVAANGGKPLRGLVCCAGIEWGERIVGKSGPHSLDAFGKVIQVNLIGTFNALRMAAAAIATTEPVADGERGVIIVTASVAAFDGQIGQAAYSASKAGIAGLVLPAARELARFGVRVVGIAPGVFDTPLMARLPEAVRTSLAAQIPFPPRLGKPEEFADTVAHIIGNPMLNGTVVRLDGALRMSGK